jgi:hypothetical protein
MARSRQPIMYRGADSAPFEGRFSLALMTRNQEQNTVARCDRALQHLINRYPGAIETMSVEVEHPIRNNPAGFQAPIPAAIQGGLR